MILVCYADFEERGAVMPAQAGIQEKYAPASGYPAWIPAFARMTWPLFPCHFLARTQAEPGYEAVFSVG